MSAGRAHWILRRGSIAPGLMVCHRCDNRRCVNLDHLFLGTARENVADMTAKGRLVVARGERLPQTKLTRAKVLAMRRLREQTGLSFAKIGKRYGVARSTARRVIVGQDWKHV